MFKNKNAFLIIERMSLTGHPFLFEAPKWAVAKEVCNSAAIEGKAPTRILSLFVFLRDFVGSQARRLQMIRPSETLGLVETLAPIGADERCKRPSMASALQTRTSEENLAAVGAVLLVRMRDACR